MIALAAALLLQASAPADVRTLNVWITDSKGSAVRGLVPEEAAVVENGVARNVTRLEQDRRPLTLAVVVDASAPMASFYRLHLVDPVVQLLNQLPEGSRFAVWTTGDRPQNLELTNSLARAPCRRARSRQPSPAAACARW